jgi:hypothetical protein
MSRRACAPLLVSLALGIAGLSGVVPSAHAQAAPQYAPAPTYDLPTSPPVAAPEPPPQGQWINTAAYGWIWVPAGASTYDVGGLPSVYLYTPVYGWAWYASPWGWGPFAQGPWISSPWSYGFRVWRQQGRGWGWHVGPSVSIQVGPRPGWGYAPHNYYYGQGGGYGYGQGGGYGHRHHGWQGGGGYGRGWHGGGGHGGGHHHGHRR